MKHYIYIFLLSICLSSCNFLDIVPDERPEIEDSYNTPSRTEGFLYSCYGYLPGTRQSDGGPKPIDRATGGEITTYIKAGDAATGLTTGNYNPAAPSIIHSDYWIRCYNGIKQCYEFLDIIDVAVVDSEQDRVAYKAEATFLIGYYHFLLLKAYGPIILIKQKYGDNVDVTTLPTRSSYDDSVLFIESKLDEALEIGLYVEQGQPYLGRATTHTVGAVKSRMYLYAASPLFNGNSEFYSAFVDEDNNHFISQQYDVNKWQKCVDASKDAIEKAEIAGYGLYTGDDVGEPSVVMPGSTSTTDFGKAWRAVRYCFMDNANQKETIFSDMRVDGAGGIQMRSSVRQAKKPPFQASNIVAPTLKMVETFYTKNGLPIDKDGTYSYENRYELVNLTDNFDGCGYAKRPKDRTIKLHLDREPRFYSWIGFHNGNYEISRYNAASLNYKVAYVPKGLKMTLNADHGAKTGQIENYSVTGYLNKKFTSPSFVGKKTLYPFPVFRLAELYLNYAEALIEVGGAANIDIAKTYIDKVRVRAGIPTINEAFKNAIGDWAGGENDQDVLRELVQNERKIELYLENHAFWDIRRWKKAEVLNERFQGWKITESAEEAFFSEPQDNPELINTFHKGQYLMPIALTEIQKMPQIIQNPHY